MKDASRRNLAIAPLICSALLQHRARQGLERSFAGSGWVETGYVFASSTGTPMDPRNLTRRFQVLAAAVGVPKQRFHDLRHFAASVQLMDGAPLNAVQQQLGHSKASTTLDIYAHVSRVIHRERAERMAELLGAGFDSSDPNCPPNCPPGDLSESDYHNGPGTRFGMWRGWRDSNPRPSVPKTDALSSELQPHCFEHI